MGTSHEPGTLMTSIISTPAPVRVSASMAPASRRSVTKLLNRLTTIANRSPAAVSWPSKTFDMLYLPAKPAHLILGKPGDVFRPRRGLEPGPCGDRAQTTHPKQDTALRRQGPV